MLINFSKIIFQISMAGIIKDIVWFNRTWL